jgi:ubiquinone/menaquinone biosynthesis C-methylase UbiE
MENQEKIWDSIAEKWFLYRDKPFKEVTDFLKDKTGKVLDFGCGSGRHFLKKEGLEFYGVDFSKKMLKLAKKKSEQINLKIVLKKSSDKIPFKENFFDFLIYFISSEVVLFLLNYILSIMYKR